MKRIFMVAVLGVMCVFASACSSSPGNDLPPGLRGVAGAGGDATGKSTSVKTTPSYATTAGSATSTDVQWERQATVPVAGDVYQLVVGDASFLPEDPVEKAYATLITAALTKAEGDPTPENVAAASTAIDKLEKYREGRRKELVSTGRDSPQVMIFTGSKIVHGTTSLDAPSPEVVENLAGLANSISEMTRAAKGQPKVPDEPKPPLVTPR